jgi:hypothetical protein
MLWNTQTSLKKIVPGQPAIIRDAKLNGEREEYMAGLDKKTVKGDNLPLNVGLSIGRTHARDRAIKHFLDSLPSSGDLETDSP